MKTIPFLLATSLAFSMPTAFANETSDVLQQVEQSQKASQLSQKKINKLADSQLTLLQQFKVELKTLEGLQVYNAQLAEQVDSQQQQIASLDQSIDQVTHVERQIVPLMIKMIDSLHAFVELDLPFNREERAERIQFLTETLKRADVSVSEKMRQVLEAYQVEIEYGNLIEAYRDTINIDNTDMEVDILRIGRTAMYYQSLDKEKSGIYNKQSRKWIALDSQYKNDIRNAIRIARKQLSPDLLNLPLFAVKEQ